jgi:hypothetical protein
MTGGRLDTNGVQFMGLLSFFHVFPTVIGLHCSCRFSGFSAILILSSRSIRIAYFSLCLSVSDVRFDIHIFGPVLPFVI